MSEIIIRVPQASDISEIADMQYASMRKLEYAEYTEAELAEHAMERDQIVSMWSERVVVTEFCDDERKSLILVAVEKKTLLQKEKVCGVIFVTVLDGWLYIRSLYVDPAAVRRKIGTALLANAFLLMLSRHYLVGMRLEVFAHNLPAVALYESFGMKEGHFEYPMELGGTAANVVPARLKIASMEIRFKSGYLDFITDKISGTVGHMLSEECRDFLASAVFAEITKAMRTGNYVPSFFRKLVPESIKVKKDDDGFDGWCEFQDWMEDLLPPDER